MKNFIARFFPLLDLSRPEKRATVYDVQQVGHMAHNSGDQIEGVVMLGFNALSDGGRNSLCEFMEGLGARQMKGDALPENYPSTRAMRRQFAKLGRESSHKLTFHLPDMSRLRELKTGVVAFQWGHGLRHAVFDMRIANPV